MEGKRDCFGWDTTRNNCKILSETICKWRKCSFYKKQGTLCDGCPDKGTGACVRCREARYEL
jgi:hypothetical protein